MNLNNYKYNVYSQNGEDGIIEEILKRLPKKILDNWCVEFGAWDGVVASNTCKLVRDSNYSAVFIESDKKKYNQLVLNFPQENVLKINESVHYKGDYSLDNLLGATDIKKSFDLLSIDIDGLDYWILDSLTFFTPKIICIEYNPTIPNMVEFINPKDFSIKQGSSARSLNELAKKKGYTLVALTITNLIFVFNKYISFFSDITNTLEELNPEGNNPNVIFSGYDGTLITTNNFIALGWHNIVVFPNRYQPLPRFLRRYSGDYSFVQRFLFRVFVLTFFPIRSIRYLINGKKDSI